MTTTITVCTTCRRPTTRDLKEKSPEGEGFLDRVTSAAADSGVRVRGTACLMGCEHGCNLAVTAEGKLAYVLGRFDGTEDDAAAIVEYATKHAGSVTGVVPFREWPQGVKGHFVARVPPLET